LGRELLKNVEKTPLSITAMTVNGYEGEDWGQERELKRHLMTHTTCVETSILQKPRKGKKKRSLEKLKTANMSHSDARLREIT